MAVRVRRLAIAEGAANLELGQEESRMEHMENAIGEKAASEIVKDSLMGSTKTSRHVKEMSPPCPQSCTWWH